MLLLLQLLQLRDDLPPHLLRDNSTHRLTDQVQLDLQLEDVGAPVTPVEDGLKLLSLNPNCLVQFGVRLRCQAEAQRIAHELLCCQAARVPNTSSLRQGHTMANRNGTRRLDTALCLRIVLYLLAFEAVRPRTRRRRSSVPVGSRTPGTVTRRPRCCVYAYVRAEPSRGRTRPQLVLRRPQVRRVWPRRVP